MATLTSIVAIHQPNYFPWFGYFSKIAQSDVFVFLDDAQFSKNSYINRTRVLIDGKKKWLTIPARFSFGDKICTVEPARSDWVEIHLQTLENYYRTAPCFTDVHPEITGILKDANAENLAEINIRIVKEISDRLGLTATFHRASELDIPKTSSDTRLIEIVHALAPEGVYLSGRGGAIYQSEERFRERGIVLRYNVAVEPPHQQSSTEFVGGLSVLDSIFERGWAATAAAIEQTIPQR